MFSASMPGLGAEAEAFPRVVGPRVDGVVDLDHGDQERPRRQAGRGQFRSRRRGGVDGGTRRHGGRGGRRHCDRERRGNRDAAGKRAPRDHWCGAATQRLASWQDQKQRAQSAIAWCNAKAVRGSGARETLQLCCARPAAMQTATLECFAARVGSCGLGKVGAARRS